MSPPLAKLRAIVERAHEAMERRGPSTPAVELRLIVSGWDAAGEPGTADVVEAARLLFLHGPELLAVVAAAQVEHHNHWRRRAPADGGCQCRLCTGVAALLAKLEEMP